MESLSILVPIFVCVVLPVSIVWIVFRSATNKDNKNAEVIIKALEVNPSLDTEKLISAFGSAVRTPEELLNLRLLRGCIFSLVGAALVVISFFSRSDFTMVFRPLGGVSLAVGIAYLIVYFVTKKKVSGAQ